MSDFETLQAENDELRAEVERLRSKNAQLLDEKKRAGGDKGELAQQIETLTAERDSALSRLHEITIENPRKEMMESLTVDGMAEPAIREILHHFDVTVEDGREMLKNKDGTPVEVEMLDDASGEPRPVALALDEAGVNALYEKSLVPALGHMLRGNQASGGGAPGSMGGLVEAEKPKNATVSNRKYGLA